MGTGAQDGSPSGFKAGESQGFQPHFDKMSVPRTSSSCCHFFSSSPSRTALSFPHLEEAALAWPHRGSSHWLPSTSRQGAAEPQARAKAGVGCSVLCLGKSLFLQSHRAESSFWHLGPGGASPRSSCILLSAWLGLSSSCISLPVSLFYSSLASPIILSVSHLSFSSSLRSPPLVCVCVYVYVYTCVYGCMLHAYVYVCVWAKCTFVCTCM